MGYEVFLNTIRNYVFSLIELHDRGSSACVPGVLMFAIMIASLLDIRICHTIKICLFCAENRLLDSCFLKDIVL